MLQSIRNTAGSWVAKVLFILLIISFGVWGIGDIFRKSGSDSTVAEIGKVKISAATLDAEFRQQVNRLRQVTGGRFDMEQARALGLVDQSLQQLVQRTLYDLAVDDAGIMIGTDLIQRRIAQERAFQGPTGRFEPDLFRRVLAANNLTEPGFIGMLRRDMARELMVGMVGVGAEPPKTLVSELYRYRQEKRTADTLTLTNAAVGDVGMPDDAALTRFHEDRAVRFTAPEYRSLTVASLTVDDIAKEITIPEDDLRAAYEARSDEFRSPERRTLSMVLVQDEATARRITEAVDGGAALDAAAGQTGTEVTVLDKVTRDELPELAPVFDRAVGTVSAPIETPLGWHVVRVDAIVPAGEASFDSVRDKLLDALRRDKAADALFELSNKLDDLLAGSTPLEEAAQRLGLRMVRVESVDAQGRTPAGTPVEGVPALQEVLKTASTMAEGTDSRLTETKEGSYFVVRVDRITPPKLRPLEEVRDQVVAGWQAEQRTRRTAALAEEAAKHLRDGNGLPEVAMASGAVPGTAGPLTRDAAPGGPLPGDLVQRLFEMKPGEVINGVTADGQMVVRLREIIPADPTAPDAGLDPVKTSVTEGLSGDLMAEFGNALRGRYPVAIHRDTLQSMYPQN